MDSLDLFYFRLVHQEDGIPRATCRIDGEVGTDVLASWFAADLRTLEAAGVREATLHILSPGGSVVEGFGIFSAMRSSPIHFTTVNDGVVASIASVIFLGGDECIMRDFSLLMIHNPWCGGAGGAKVDEVLDKMRTSIITILAQRSGMSPERVGVMMDEETWFSAEQAVELGFATAIQATEALLELSPVESVSNLYALCNNLYKTNPDLLMEETPEVVALATDEVVETPVAELAGVEVVDVAETPDAVVAELPEAVEVPMVSPIAAAATEELAAAQLRADELAAAAQLQVTNAELLRVNQQLSERLAVLEQTMNQAAEAAVQAQANEADQRATALVAGALAAGKIQAAATEQWTELARNHYATTEAALAAIKLGRTATRILARAGYTPEQQAAAQGVNLKELMRTNPTEAQRLYEQEPDRFAALYQDAYGVAPTR